MVHSLQYLLRYESFVRSDRRPLILLLLTSQVRDLFLYDLVPGSLISICRLTCLRAVMSKHVSTALGKFKFDVTGSSCDKYNEFLARYTQSY